MTYNHPRNAAKAKSSPTLQETTILHPRNTTNLFAHDKIAHTLLNAFHEQQRVHHAIIISGIRGIGKATLIYYLMKLIFSNKDVKNTHPSYDIDTDCRDIALLIKNSHPDIMVLETTTEKQITVEQMRSMLNFINMRPTHISHKIVIIDAINNLNISSSHAMLKALEEPCGHTMFFLIHHNEKDIMPTIRSRCAVIKVPHLNSKQASDILHHLPMQLTRDIISDLSIVSDNIPLFAVQLFLSDGLAIYEKILHVVAKKADCHNLAKEIANDELYETVSILIKRFLRTCVIASSGTIIDMLPLEATTIRSYLKSNNLINLNIVKTTEAVLYILHQWKQSHLHAMQATLAIFHTLKHGPLSSMTNGRTHE